MKTTLLSLAAIVAFASAAPAFAQIKDTAITVSRRTLDREDKVGRPRQNRAELTRGLHITVKNSGTKPLAAGEVEWAILVERPGPKRALLSTGKEPVKALAAGQEASFDVGAVPVAQNGAKKQEMEYSVIVRRGGAEEAKVTSIPSFDQQAKEAHPMDGKQDK
jgi:hypothetical protein